MLPVIHLQPQSSTAVWGTVLRPGMLVRGRVVASGNGMVFEHPSGKIAMERAGQSETGWKTWRVEQGPSGLVLRAVSKAGQASTGPQDPLTALQRMLTILFPGRRAHKGERTSAQREAASTVETLLLAAHPESEQIVRELCKKIRTHRSPLELGNTLYGQAEEAVADEKGVRLHAMDQGDASLLVCHKVFPDNENVPVLLVRTGQGKDAVIWLCTGLELSELGAVFIGLRMDQHRISADLWCHEQHMETLREELGVRCPWPVRIRGTREVPEVLAWSFASIMESLPGGVDAKA